MFKQWKSRVCNAHRSVESVNFGEHSASLLESFWNLSIFVASLCLGGVFAKSLPKSLWSLHEFTVQSLDEETTSVLRGRCILSFF